MALQGLACGYYGIFGGLMAGFGVVWFGIGGHRWRQLRYWLLAAGAALVALLLVGPFYAPYLEIRDAGFGRTLADARLHAADWRAYFVSPMWMHRWLLDLVRRFGDWREVLFPGVLPIALATLALVRGLRRRDGRDVPVTRSVLGFYAALGGLACWASFGPDGGLYTLLHETMPFFSMIRAPARFGLLVTMALAILGGVGLASLDRSLAARPRRVVVAVVLVFAVARSTVGGLVLFDLPPTPLAYQRLSALPRGAVAEFPFWIGPVDRHRHTEYMLWSTVHWQPLINGYSDHIPPAMVADMPRLATFPDPAAWRVLRDREARYVVLHWHMLDESAQRTLRDALTPYRRLLRPVVEQPAIALYEIVGWPPGQSE
jgi:hypothetical protein